MYVRAVCPCMYVHVWMLVYVYMYMCVSSLHVLSAFSLSYVCGKCAEIEPAIPSLQLKLTQRLLKAQKVSFQLAIYYACLQIVCVGVCGYVGVWECRWPVGGKPWTPPSWRTTGQQLSPVEGNTPCPPR